MSLHKLMSILWVGALQTLMVTAFICGVPHEAIAEYVPSQQDTLSSAHVFRAGTEAFPEAVAASPYGGFFMSHSDLNRPDTMPADTSTYVLGFNLVGVETLRYGSGDYSLLKNPSAIDFTSDGRAVIADAGNDRIVVISATTGDLISVLGTGEEFASWLTNPCDVAVAPDNTVWIADTWESELEHWDLAGNRLGSFRVDGYVADEASPMPESVAFDGVGNLWCAFPSENYIQCYSPGGTLLKTISDWNAFNEQGQPYSDTLAGPRDVVFDQWDTMYIADTSSSRRLVRLTADGEWLGTYNPDGALLSVSDIDVDSSGNVWATDPADDSIKRFDLVKFNDTYAPVTTSDIDPTWQTHAVTVTLFPTDRDDDLANTYYGVGTSDPTTPYAGPFTVSREGTTVVSYRSVDAQGAREDVRLETVRIDSSAPTTTVMVPSTTWGLSTPVSVQASDTVSGIAEVWYRIDGGPTHPYTGPFDYHSLGAHTIQAWSVDHAGNSSAVSSADFNLEPPDDKPPITTSDIPAGWMNDSVTLHLSAIDDVSGVATTLYSVDGSFPALDYPGSVTVSSEGTTVVQWFSTDRNGNVEPMRAANVRIDRNPPVTTSDAFDTYETSATITLTATDAVSSVAKTEYRVDGGTWKIGRVVSIPSAGPHTIQWRSTDVAGLVEATKTKNIMILGGRYEQTSQYIYYRGTWSQIDNASLSEGSMHKATAGPALAQISFKGTAVSYVALKSPLYGIAKVTLDNEAPTYVDLFDAASAWKSAVWTRSGLSDTTHTVRVEFTGTKNPLASADQLNVDAFDITGVAGPDTTSPETMADVTDQWRSTTALVTLSVTDLGSWATSTRYSLAGAPATAYTVPFSVSAEGTTVVTYRSTDFAGNTESTQTTMVRIDRTAPTTTIDPLGQYKTSTSVSLRAIDGASGVAESQWRIDGGAWTQGNTAVLPYSPGRHTLEYRSTDNAGNTEVARSATYDMMNHVEQTDTRLYLQGGWFRIDNAQLSGGSMHKATSGPAAAYMQFKGTAVDYIALKSPRYGIAKVTLDGGTPMLVDLYDAGSVWRGPVWGVSGLADTTHTVCVEFTGDKNPLATASELNIDAFDVAGTMQDFSMTAEQSDSRLYSDPAWFTIDNASLSGGSMRKALSAGSTYVTFKGTAIDLVALKAARYGIASVRLDGNATETVDLYSPTSSWQQTVWSKSGLSDTTHTVAVSWTGGKNAAATDSEVNLDAVRIRGTFVQHRARHESSSSKFYFTPDWSTVNSTNLSAGSMRKVNEADSSAFISFKGTEIDLIGLKTVSYGIAKVSLDGGAEQDVDLYSSTDKWQEKIWGASGLSDTTHTVTFSWSGSKNPASTGTAVGLDAIEVVGALATAVPTRPVYQRHEQDSPSLAYTGSWFSINSSNVSGGTIAKSGGIGDTAYVSFKGTGLKLLGLKTPSYGMAEISLDGGIPTAVDLYSPTDQWKSKIWAVEGLSDTTHTVSFQWTGDRNAASSGTAIAFDGVDVLGSLVQATAAGVTPWMRNENSAAGISYVGTWSSVPSVNLSGGSAMKASAPATVTVRFNGTACSWIALKTRSYGIASVSVDGGDPQAVDLYAATDTWKSKVWSVSGLEDGPHTITIGWTGTKNSSSTGTAVMMDAVDLRGTLTP